MFVLLKTGSRENWISFQPGTWELTHTSTGSLVKAKEARKGGLQGHAYHLPMWMSVQQSWCSHRGFSFSVSPDLSLQTATLRKTFLANYTLIWFLWLWCASSLCLFRVSCRENISDKPHIEMVSLWCESWCELSDCCWLKNSSDRGRTEMASLWCESWCELSDYRWLKNSSDKGRAEMVSLWCTPWCGYSKYFAGKTHFWQIPHWYGFSLVCVLMCFFKVFWSEKYFWQN